MLENIRGHSRGSIPPLRMPSPLPHDLCHEWNVSRRLPAEDIIQDKESWYNEADITDALLSITLHVDDRISLMYAVWVIAHHQDLPMRLPKFSICNQCIG